jgi:5-methyltetrahydrofolate--homocysteine methyltransferase
VCLSDPERVEINDVHAFYPELIKRIKAPIMIDSTDAESTRVALTYCPGKAIINSINLEDGLDRFESIVPLAKTYGAALVVGCIDDDPDQGMALTVARKLEIARKSLNILVDRYDFPKEDIYFDPLVFPCATGDENYKESATQTVEGIRVIKEEFPECKTILGISNVSFGLPLSGREVLNSVFLHHCVEAGLDLAIVNAAKYLPVDMVSNDERTMCESLLWTGNDEAIARFAEFYRKKKAKPKAVPGEELPVEKILANCVIEGTKEGLIPALKKILGKMRPLAVINGPLMDGMTEVGRLFGKNELIVAEVLQSAEVMKASVSFLEPHMDKGDTMHKGKMLLATVKGDVHDIGKNLVDIIFSNNGFDVINLGIKVPPETLVDEVRKHSPDFIGLSGLLVKMP